MSARILVVDDSPTIRKVVAAILERSGYASLLATDGVDALEVLERESVDLVLLDFVMPRMNGYQLCRELRGRPQFRALPVILMSAKGDKIRGQFLRQTGAVDAITKPFDARGLVAVVEAALRRHAQGRASSSSPPPLVEPEPDSGPEDSLSAAAPEGSAAARIQWTREFSLALLRTLEPELVAQAGLSGAALETVKRAVIKALSPEAVIGLGTRFAAIEAAGGRRQVLAGDIAVISIAEVLQLLQLQRQTGALLVTTRGAEVVLHIRDGSLDLATSRGLRDEFLLGRYLVEDGALTRTALEETIRQNTQRQPLGEHLMSLGLATEAQIRRALERQSSELIYELVRWQNGRFAFEIGPANPIAAAIGLRLPLEALAMEGFRRVDEWRLIEGTFDFEEVLYRDELAVERLEGELTRPEREILTLVNGVRTVRELVNEREGSSFDLCKILYQLVNSKLIRRKST